MKKKNLYLSDNTRCFDICDQNANDKLFNTKLWVPKYSFTEMFIAKIPYSSNNHVRHSIFLSKQHPIFFSVPRAHLYYYFSNERQHLLQSLGTEVHWTKLVGIFYRKYHFYWPQEQQTCCKNSEIHVVLSSRLEYRQSAKESNLLPKCSPVHTNMISLRPRTFTISRGIIIFWKFTSCQIF